MPLKSFIAFKKEIEKISKETGIIMKCERRDRTFYLKIFNDNKAVFGRIPNDINISDLKNEVLSMNKRFLDSINAP